MTPNHFFHGQAGGQLAPEVVDKIDFHPRRHWLQLQQLIKGFWKRWLHKFLPMLNARRKWTEKSKHLTVDEVVLCLEPRLPRGNWSLGRIEQIHSAPDGHVRVAHVRTGGNVYVPSYVHWNWTQMQRTNIDADYYGRGFSLRLRDQYEL